MFEEGRVIQIDKDKVLVKLKRSERCAGCRACSLNEDGFMLAEAEPRSDVKPGFRVLLEKKWEDTRKSVLLVLFIPLAALMAGAVGGFAIARNFVESTALQNVIGMLSGVALMALSMGVAHRYDRKIRASDFGKMKIVKILGKGPEVKGQRPEVRPPGPAPAEDSSPEPPTPSP